MSSFILDTHILIWLAEDPNNLSQVALKCIHSDNKLFVSFASVWEMAIKMKTGKLTLSFPLEEFIEKAVEKHALSYLQIFIEHIYHTQHLLIHHNDPFDRLLISQSIVEDIPIISSDEIFDAYGVKRIWR